MHKEIGVAIWGSGAAGSLHAAAVAETPGMRLEAVVARSESSEELARAYGCAHLAVDEVLRSQATDLVVIATPTEAHAKAAAAVIGAGKHVLIEKPVDEDPAVCDDLHRRAERAGVLALPGHNYLYQPECRRLIESVRTGQIGEPRSLHIHYAIKHSESLAARYHGVLREVMVHHAYITLAALGAPDRVDGGTTAHRWRSLETDDQAWMAWSYDSGALALHYATFGADDMSSDALTFRVKALGTEGSIGYSWRDATYAPGDSPFSVDIPLYRETYVHQMRAVRDMLRREASPLSSLSDAALVARIIRKVAQRPTPTTGIGD